MVGYGGKMAVNWLLLLLLLFSKHEQFVFEHTLLVLLFLPPVNIDFVSCFVLSNHILFDLPFCLSVLCLSSGTTSAF